VKLGTQDNNFNLKRMWDKVAKKPKINSTSKPTLVSIEVESQNQDENVSNPPSSELRLALVKLIEMVVENHIWMMVAVENRRLAPL
jgi:hypothetical protein